MKNILLAVIVAVFCSCNEPRTCTVFDKDFTSGSYTSRGSYVFSSRSLLCLCDSDLITVDVNDEQYVRIEVGDTVTTNGWTLKE